MIYCRTCGHEIEWHDSYPAEDGEHLDYSDCLFQDCTCLLFISPEETPTPGES